MTALLMERSSIARYALAVTVSIAVAGLHWALHYLVESRVPFLFFLPALLLSSMYAGRGPGFVVLVAGAANGMLLLPPTGLPVVDAQEDRIALAVYALVGIFLVFIGARLGSANHRAAAAERRLALAQENSGVGLFEIDLASRTIFASATLCRLLGRDPSDGDFGNRMSLDAWNASLKPDDLLVARTVLKQQLAEGAEAYAYEHHVDLPDGRLRWLHTNVHIERNGAGRASRLRGASLDITERKRVDALLEKTQGELTHQVADLRRLHELSSRLPEMGDLHAQLKSILESLAAFHGCEQGLISLYDAERNCLAMEASLGFSDAGLKRLAIVSVGDGSCGLAFSREKRVIVEDTESDPCFESFRDLAHGEGFRAVHSTPLVSADGSVLGVISVYLNAPRELTEREMRLADICARKAAVFIERDRAQAVARESDQRFRVAIESAAVPFTVLSPVRRDGGLIVDFQWLYVNHAAAAMLQRDVEELVGRRVRDVLPGSWDEPGLLETYVAVAEHGEVREFELHTTTEGRDGWFHVVASPLQGSVAIWLADITERKRNEQALHEADRRKDEFLATLAHELRNPLAPIRQAALISKSPAASEAQKNWSHDVIERQVQHMALLLDDLLDVSRITRGMLHLRKARTDLASVVDAAVETARPLIDARQHRLVIDMPDRHPQFEADQLRVAQVVANLLTNAAKYTDPGGIIRLSASCSEDVVSITVTDSGIGIRQDALCEIFQMFNQVRATQDRSNGGLGIGLALAKGLVELHGGSISAHSDGPGMGSRFTVRLPVQCGAHAGSDAGSVLPVRTTVRRRVLVVDDNMDAADTLAEFLRIEGHEVRVVYDGLSALESFDDFGPDTVMLDIGMPRVSGIEVARRLRENPFGRKAMLIAVTGWGQEKDKSKALAAGFDHHLTKPIDLRRLTLLLTEPALGLADTARHA